MYILHSNTMAESLMFQAFSAIFHKSSQLYKQVSATECKKERKESLRKLKHHPIVRLQRIISSSAGHKNISIPRVLTKDEVALKHALDNCLSLQLELGKFYRQVMQPARDTEHFERRLCQFTNDSNQHPDLYPYPTEALEVQRELQFLHSDEYLEMGKTYCWYLHRYGETPSFYNATTHGNCESCNEGLPVWRSCSDCAYEYFIYGRDDIYVQCLECRCEKHQNDLENVTKCHNCGGPPSILSIKLPEPDTEVWYQNDDGYWDWD